MTLIEYIKNNRYYTDKIDLGYIDNIYNEIISNNRDEFKNILEIGIHNGESIKLWRDFFSNAIVTGIDINRSNNITNKNRIVEIYDNAYSEDVILKLNNQTFDLIIDDGPHTLESMIFFIKKYVPLLSKIGYAVIEDIIDTRWSNRLIDTLDLTQYNYSLVNMAGKAINPWHKEKWKNGLDVLVIKKI